MRSLAQKIKAEDMPPLLYEHDNYPILSADIVHVVDRSLAGRLKM